LANGIHRVKAAYPSTPSRLAPLGRPARRRVAGASAAFLAAVATASAVPDEVFLNGDPYHPFLGMWTTITREGKGYEGSLNPQQALSWRQAIELYTRTNADLLFRENEIGSFEVGKRADFIVVDRDLLTCPVDDIKDARALETWVDGRRAYSDAAR
jgi:predicted amidohydrolase YtcJ